MGEIVLGCIIVIIIIILLIIIMMVLIISFLFSYHILFGSVAGAEDATMTVVITGVSDAKDATMIVVILVIIFIII